MDEAEFAELPDKLDVAQHFDLCNSTLLLFLRGERAVLFVKHYTDETFISITNTGRILQPVTHIKHNSLTFNISGTVLKLILKLGNKKSSESLKKSKTFLLLKYKIKVK